MSFFRELLVSLGLRKRAAPKIGLRPHRDVTVPLGVEAAHERVLDAIDRTLGANIYLDDRITHTIEAGFGTINQERLRISFEPRGDAQTFVRIEAHYPAGVEHPARSLAVDTLVDALSSRA